jgi:hypothetical protein
MLEAVVVTYTRRCCVDGGACNFAGMDCPFFKGIENGAPVSDF